MLVTLLVIIIMFVKLSLVCVYRRRMSSRIAELEESVEQARSRAAKLEKERNRLQIEIRDVVTELEEVTASL